MFNPNDKNLNIDDNNDDFDNEENWDEDYSYLINEDIDDDNNGYKNSIDLEWSRAMADLIELGFTDTIDDGNNSRKR